MVCSGKYLALLLCYASYARSLFVCPENYCSGVDCSQELSEESCAAQNGRFEEKGGFCGCCPKCITQIGEGQSCIAVTLLGSPRGSECASGLYCDLSTKTCKKRLNQRSDGACAASLNEFRSQPPLLGRTKPVCDPDGSYAAKQCRGSRCYCVEADGTVIEGPSVPIQESAGMLCTCARDRAAYRKLGIIGKMFRCTSNGNYDSIQCTGSVCYCADPRTGKQLGGSEGVPIGRLTSLNC